ncbi:hypothetical protein BN000_02596 [Mycobacterium europaeum]|uniref:Secreted protein n=1 Tax=Mycobacterium europaeum TaxID=761804 RepID=A0A0U1DBY9_9MYCO|nr:hypothetical protein [Mycobacterium europaeum]CQD12301.1 hypothetical protein BN000_02596 [Mycobacterium europaeum]
MKKVYSLTMLFFLVPLALGVWSPWASADNSDAQQYVEFYVDNAGDSQMKATSNGIALRSESLYDNNKWKYGVKLYLDNNRGKDVYAKVRVAQSTNVTGHILEDNFLLPNGRSQSLGSFKAKVYGKAWSVDVDALACDVDAPPEACPDF